MFRIPARPRLAVLATFLAAAPVVASAEPELTASRAVELLERFGQWTGEPFDLPVRIVTVDDGEPAPGAYVEITTASGSERFTADTEGRALVRLTPAAARSQTRVVSPDGREVRIRLMLSVRTVDGELAGELHAVSTMGAPVVPVPGWRQRVYARADAHDDALRVAAEVARANELVAGWLGRPWIPFDVLLTGLGPDASFVTEGGSFGLSEEALGSEVDLTSYVHETVEHFLVEELDLYAGQNRWIGDGIAEWTALSVAERTSPGRAFDELDGDIALLRELRRGIGLETYDLLRDFRVSTHRSALASVESNEAMLTLAAGYPIAASLWTELLDEAPAARLGRLIDLLESSRRRRPRWLARHIDSLTGRAGLAARLNDYPVGRAIDVLERRHATLRDRVVWELAGGLSFALGSEPACDRLRVAVAADGGALRTDVPAVVVVGRGEAARELRFRLVPTSTVTVRAERSWHELVPTAAGWPPAQGGVVSLAFHVPVARGAIPRDERTRGAALVLCDERPVLLEELTVGRDDLSVRAGTEPTAPAPSAPSERP